MNQIIKSFLEAHINEYSLEEFKEEGAFEHFINRCVINQHTVDRFDPSETMTDAGEIGIDGVAIIINDRFVNTIDVARDIISNSKEFTVNFVFVQSKTSEKFDGGEIGTFIYGVRLFFGLGRDQISMNSKMDNLIKIKDYIFQNSINFSSNPELNMYYVCCGKWEESNGLATRAESDYDVLLKSQNFSKIQFIPYDSDNIINSYKELKKKVKKSITMEKNISFPTINGVNQAFLGLVKCKDYVDLLKDSNGNIMRNIFEDNVRDFQGYNIVNKEIKDTLSNYQNQESFVVLNNGITIVAKTISRTGDTFHIHNYQIVNGCQTSYVLFDNYENLQDNTYVSIKIIETSSNELSDKIIFTTNRQTEVKSEAFESTKKFHKKLEDYYNSIGYTYRLYYERRSKQYDLEDEVNKNKVITLATQTSAYVAMFLNEPHSTHRYYGEILKAYSGRLYLENDRPEPYYISAYYIYQIEKLMKEGEINKKYRLFKYHIICAMRAIIVGRKLMRGNSKEIIKACEKLNSVLKDKEKFKQYIDMAIGCIDKVLIINKAIPKDEQNRTKDITMQILDASMELNHDVEHTDYLKKGSKVFCTVKHINKSFVSVEIETDDIRNYGFIHISRLTGKYISNLLEEVKLAEKIEAYILDNNFNEEYGWELSKI